MPKVICNWLDCKYNKNHQCKANYIRLNNFDVNFDSAEVNGNVEVEDSEIYKHFIEGLNCTKFKLGKKVNFDGK